MVSLFPTQLLFNFCFVVFRQKFPTVWLCKILNIITTTQQSVNHKARNPHVTLSCNTSDHLADHQPGNNSATSDQHLPRITNIPTDLTSIMLYRARESSVQDQYLQKHSQNFFWKRVECLHPWLTESFGILDQLKCSNLCFFFHYISHT